MGEYAFIVLPEHSIIFLIKSGRLIDVTTQLQNQGLLFDGLCSNVNANALLEILLKLLSLLIKTVST